MLQMRARVACPLKLTVYWRLDEIRVLLNVEDRASRPGKDRLAVSFES